MLRIKEINFQKILLYATLSFVEADNSNYRFVRVTDEKRLCWNSLETVVTVEVSHSTTLA